MSLGMLKSFRLVFIFLALSFTFSNAKSIDFDLIKKGEDNNNTLLIIGGIQGDEPGGFMAASLIATHYEITKGSVWIVPNLNFYSIIKRNRGPYGDMNRKFAKISEDDPDFNSVERIKELITDDEVKLILNLHDGSGFYREKYEDSYHSPYKWGQSSIIDQANLNVQAYGNLEEISSKVCEHINKKLLSKEHMYRVKNTKTRLGDKEMEKTLTYFAINNGKAAFGHEASKELNVEQRTYYHLLALEKYMDIMGIEFKRKFDFTLADVKDVIDNDIYITFYDDKIKLPLSQIRNYLRYFPVRKDGSIEFVPSNPLMTVIKEDGVYSIHYGNRRLARITPDYFDIDDESSPIDMILDGEQKQINFGDIVTVDDKFYIKPMDGYRTNVIGYVNPKYRNESGITIKKDQILKNFSIDKKGMLFRVEFYKDEKFAGMVLINFDKDSASSKNEYSFASTNEIRENEPKNL